MPRLKKFRVVNLVYNDTRHIYDETFDFHEGEHAMMLLANGGGKTVLTQMMMQPVIPKTDLKTRKFTDYFKNNRRPTLLMSEWQLDDDGGSLLTGLVIKHRSRKVRGSEDDKESLEIHAFTIHYHYSETYKIDTVPVTVVDESGRKSMMTFDAIVNGLTKHEHKFKDYVQCFKWSDSREAKDQYGHKLREYGIIQQEWRDNILKINREEAGLKSFFEDAKTGQTLLKRKILPTIESKLEERVRDKVELKTLFRKHAEEEVKNKNIIENEKLYNQFIKDSDEFLHKTAELKASIELTSQARSNIQALTLGLLNLKHQIEADYRTKDEARLENRRQIDKIQIEEMCYEYYRKLSHLEAEQIEHETLFKAYEHMAKQLKTKDYEVRILQASRIYAALVEIREKVQANKLEIKQLVEDNDEKDLQTLGEVLSLRYAEDILEIQGEIKVIEGLNLDIDAAIQKIVEALESLYKIKQEKQRTIHIAEHKVNEFDDKVRKLNDHNDDFAWEKHPLYGDYEEIHLNDYIHTIKSHRDEKQTKIKDLEVRQEAHSKKVLALEEAVQKYLIDQASDEAKLIHSKASFKHYKMKESQLLEQLKALQIKEQMIFDQAYVTSQLEEIIAGKTEAYNHLTIERSMTIQLMESLREGRLLSLPVEVIDYLKKHQIDYQYGYEWLRLLDSDDIDEALYMDAINVLPFALVMDDGNYNRFRALEKSYQMSQVLPVVAESYIRKVVDGEGSQVSNDGLMIHTAFEQELLDEAYVGKRIDALSRKIDEIEADQRALTDSREFHSALYNRYQEFVHTYTVDSKDQLEMDVVALEEGIELSKIDCQKAQAEVKFLREEIQSFKEGQEAIGIDLIGILNQCRTYIELQEAFVGYQENKKLVYVLGQELEKSNQRIDQCNLEIEALKDKKSKHIRVVDHKKKGIAEITKRLGGLSRTMDEAVLMQTDYYKKDMSSLEIEYDVLNRASGNVRSAKEALEANQARVLDYEKRIEDLKVEKSDYDTNVFEQSLLDEATGQKESFKKDLGVITTKLNEKQGEINSLTVSLAEKKAEILEKKHLEALLPKEALVHTDYREQKHRNKVAHDQLRDELVALKTLLSEVSNSIGELSDHQVDSSFEVEAIVLSLPIANVEINTKKRQVMKDLAEGERKEATARNQVFAMYTNLRSKNDHKNDLFNNMFRHLLTEDHIYDYDFTKRVISQAIESIRRILEKYETDLNALKDKEVALYGFVQEKVANVYDELKDIDKHSIIELNGKREKMLHIDLPSKESIELSGLNYYMKEIIRLAKVKIENKDYEDLDVYLDNHLKLEHIFDEYIPINRIGIAIAKVEQNKVSKMSWEKVGKASGGEVFVSVFIMFSSLISYTRGYQLSRKKHGTVLVMDNPFGPVSSEHLLAPLFKIAQTYDTQMICYTHINTSAITNQFDLIYSLRVVQEGGSSREHLSAELSKDKNNQLEFIDSGLFEIGEGDQVGFL